MKGILPILIAIVVFCLIGHILKAHVQLNPGDILVIDADAGTGFRGALFSIDPSAGDREVISNFGSYSKGKLRIEKHYA